MDETFTVVKKHRWHENPTFFYVLLTFCVLLFLSAALGWPLGVLKSRLCREEGERKKFPKFPRLIAGLMSALHLVFLIGMIAVLSNFMELMFGVPPMLKTLSILTLIAVILTVGVFLSLLLVWSRDYWTICGRVHYTLVFLAGCLFIWFLSYWHLLGFKL